MHNSLVVVVKEEPGGRRKYKCGTGEHDAEGEVVEHGNYLVNN